MAQELATEQIRLYPSTHKRLKIRAIRESTPDNKKTVAELVDELSKMKPEYLSEEGVV